MTAPPPSAAPRPWQTAWHEALYGSRGFYREHSPLDHFVTATDRSFALVLAGALSNLATDHGIRRVVDVGCGRGELLTTLAEIRPDLPLMGVDVVPRPNHLPERIDWLRSPGGAALPTELDDLEDALVIAHEWLDVVPCVVAEVDESGVARGVLVDDRGVESLGDPVAGADLDWLRTWWPASAAGDRIEVGRARDEAWADLVGRVRSGVVVGIDYGHDRATRPSRGTLIGYRDGRSVEPAPDGLCDVTAHVAVDSLAAAERLRQRDALARWTLETGAPTQDQARTDPLGYLAALSHSSARTALRSNGFGDFWWIITPVTHSDTTTRERTAPHLTAEALTDRLTAIASTDDATGMARFFKTGPGQYGEGDVFIGVRNGPVAAVAWEFHGMPIAELARALDSPIHEVRAAALRVMAKESTAKRTTTARRDELAELYLASTDRINNWDLVDLSAGDVLGSWLTDRPRGVLHALARSNSLWERRIAILATSHWVKAGEFDDCLAVIDILIDDREDLIHKAVGWWLREIGKKDDRVLYTALDRYAATMPRTALRYALERTPADLRAHYLGLSRSRRSAG